MPTLTTANTTLYYQEFGSGDEVVLSAHMDVSSGESYQKLLGDAGLHVYDIQLRGFGRSAHVSEQPASGWYPTWAEDVFQFARTLGVDRFVYTGVSHGAGVGWNVALAHPDAVKAFVAVVGGPHDRSQPRIRGIGVDGENPPPFFLVPTTDPLRLRRRAELARVMQERRTRVVSPEERAINPGRVFPELETNEQVAARLAEVRVPTLLLNGAQDDLIPAQMSLLVATSVPGAKLVLYQDHSHMLAREAPERLVEEVKLFLRECGVL
jgi:pimeloyl-ACP methyl ester carboxylesterase